MTTEGWVEESQFLKNQQAAQPVVRVIPTKLKAVLDLMKTVDAGYMKEILQNFTEPAVKKIMKQIGVEVEEVSADRDRESLLAYCKIKGI